MATEPLVYYIPEGIPNLETLFPDVPWDQVKQWSLQVKDSEGNVLATTRTNKVGCCCTDVVRIHFVNYCGEIDSINFSRPEETHETKSDSREKPLRHPLNRSLGGEIRKNITSNEVVEAETTCYSEADQGWIQELADTPMAWVEMNLPNGFLASTEKAYIPIRIMDMKLALRKNERRYEYLVKIKYQMSNSNILLR